MPGLYSGFDPHPGTLLAAVGDLEQMIAELGSVIRLDRSAVRARAGTRFGVQRMVDEYVDVYRGIVDLERGLP